MRETKRKNLTRDYGITLIALVVTIVVLLILAGVSINLVIGNNGIITNAKKAKVETKAATVSDERDMWMNDRYLAKQIGETPKSMEDILSELETRKILTLEDVQKIKNNPNNEITIGSKTISFKIGDVSRLKVGDFVNYSAGTWTQEEIDSLGDLYAGENMPTSTTIFRFGGFKAGDSKDATRTPYSTYVNKYESGWRVLSVESDGTVKIVHAGTPEGYYHPIINNSGYQSEYILCGIKNNNAVDDSIFEELKIRNWRMYENHHAIAGLAHNITYDEAYNITGNNFATESVRATGSWYWISKASNPKYLYGVYGDGILLGSSDTVYNNGGNICRGIRPVVTLKSGLEFTANAGDLTHITPETAWNIRE